MTLEEASSAALEAARAGELDALAAALTKRAAALAKGETPTPGVHTAGELIAQLLRDTIRETGLESARLKQLGLALGDTSRPPSIDVAG